MFDFFGQLLGYISIFFEFFMSLLQSLYLGIMFAQLSSGLQTFLIGFMPSIIGTSMVIVIAFGAIKLLTGR